MKRKRKGSSKKAAERPVEITVPLTASKPVVVEWPVTVEPPVVAEPVPRSAMGKVYDFFAWLMSK